MIKDLKSMQKKLRVFVKTLPGAYEDHPWGETVAKVGKKVFVFGLSTEKKPGHEIYPGIGVKLAASHAVVSNKSYAEPAGYGLGKSGWVGLRFDRAESPTEEELREWITESYCLVAPKKLSKQLAGSADSESTPSKTGQRRKKR